MAYKEDEKTLAADIKISLLEKFEKQWKARGQVQKRAVAAALRFWMSLPEDLQAKLISEELGEDDFLSLITQIIDDRIRTIKQALAKDIRKKRDKKARRKS
jgi:hypothetical protein